MVRFEVNLEDSQPGSIGRKVNLSNTAREWFDEQLSYEAWANRAWLEALPRFQDSARAEGVFHHILDAQEVWLQRTWSLEDSGTWPDDLSDKIEFGTSQWREFIRICDPEAFVSYNNRAGDSCFNTVEQIVRHLLNHGTYHRGQLRGLAMAEGLQDFPETDFILYWRKQQSVAPK